MTPSRVWAPLDDPRDPIRHDSAGARAEGGVLRRHKAWQSDHPALGDYWCEHATYVGFERALAFLCPRCPEYAEAADNSHPMPEWDAEGEFPAGFKVAA